MLGPQKWPKEWPASCQLLKILKQVQNFVGFGQSNWFPLKLMINSILIRRALIRFFIKIWGSRRWMWSLFHSLTDKSILPRQWSGSWQMRVCWKYTTHFITWPHNNQSVFLVHEVKSASRGKKYYRTSRHQGERKCQIKCSSFGYLWWLICNFKWQLVGKLQLSLISVVKKLLGISW